MIREALEIARDFLAVFLFGMALLFFAALAVGYNAGIIQ